MGKKKQHRQTNESTESNEIPIHRRPVLSRGVKRGIVACLLLLIVSGLLCADWYYGLPADAKATYVGNDRCIQCHQEQAKQWHGSHHQLAMQKATDQTVLADFNHQKLEHYGITSTMFKSGDQFMINTEGPDGKMADFEVKYVFGVEPLQQYMVEFDRPANMPENEIARLQVLRVSWDTEKKKWFYLRPPDVDEKLAPNDDLHWTGIAQRWNTMCADCHSTNLKENYDVPTQTYHTTFTNISVGCEACHGPGSLHVELAEAKSLFWDRKHQYGLARLKSKDSHVQLESCAPCHSRRRVVQDEFHAGKIFTDHFAVELLDEATYHPDGQIKDEVYVYGSFLQSKMYHKGIRCTDCHDPHTARLKYDGNKVCTSCHEHPAGKYDIPSHHQHNVGSTGSSCVECHMPETTYMEVDPRRDHSLRIPRPDLSVKHGSPNACTKCHLDRAKVTDAEKKKLGLRQYADWIRVAAEGNEKIKAELKAIDQWAADAAKRWYSNRPKTEERLKHYAHALFAAREHQPDAKDQLLEVINERKYPAIARASAIRHLGLAPDIEFSPPQLERLLKDKDPMIRAAAVAAFDRQEADDRIRYIVPRLTDVDRSVRTEAARVLSELGRPVIRNEGLSVSDAFDKAFAELREGIMAHRDRAAAHLNMGILYEQMGEPNEAIAAYRTALKLETETTGPRSNLASLLERQNEAQLRQLSAARQGSAEYYQSVQTEIADRAIEIDRLRKEELELLKRDAKLAPDNAAIRYRLGLNLYLQRKYSEAEIHLLKARELDKHISDYVMTLALFYEKLRQFDKAEQYARTLLQMTDSVTNREIFLRIQQGKKAQQGAGKENASSKENNQ